MLTVRSQRPHLSLAEDFLALDSPGEHAFFSHAHSDHVSTRVKHVLASPETLSLVAARGVKLSANVLAHTHWSAHGVTLELRNAGHVLGSKQLLVHYDGSSFLYTSDFNPSPSLLFPGAQAPSGVDCLLIESTFGKPEYVFPPREVVHQSIAKWVQEGMSSGNNMVLGGYELGKAQELVAILNKYAGIAPLVNAGIARICEVYNRFGSRLDFISADSPEGSAMLSHPFAAILPHGQLRPGLAVSLSSFYKRPVRTAVASGWAASARFAGVDSAFILSDHADFPGLLSFVEQCSPKKVFVNHGFTREFSHELRIRGYAALPFESQPAPEQKTLTTPSAYSRLK